jgi:hypothetical protein
VGTEPAERPGIALLASPLLGPAVWKPVAGLLADSGWKVLVPAPFNSVSSPEEVLARLVDALPPGEPLILVAHSNVGLYVAALAAVRDVRGVVFVDAGLPSDETRTPTAPAPFREFLAGLADAQGILPVWTSWWAEEDLSGIFPDAVTRAAVEAEQVRLPLDYFDAAVPSPPGWAELPGAYLAFGDAYAVERASAEERGWPTATLAGDHLHPLVDPEGVVRTLVGLLGRLGFVST